MQKVCQRTALCAIEDTLSIMPSQVRTGNHPVKELSSTLEYQVMESDLGLSAPCSCRMRPFGSMCLDNGLFTLLVLLDISIKLSCRSHPFIWQKVLHGCSMVLPLGYYYVAYKTSSALTDQAICDLIEEEKRRIERTRSILSSLDIYKYFVTKEKRLHIRRCHRASQTGGEARLPSVLQFALHHLRADNPSPVSRGSPNTPLDIAISQGSMLPAFKESFNRSPSSEEGHTFTWQSRKCMCITRKTVLEQSQQIAEVSHRLDTTIARIRRLFRVRHLEPIMSHIQVLHREHKHLKVLQTQIEKYDLSTVSCPIWLIGVITIDRLYAAYSLLHVLYAAEDSPLLVPLQLGGICLTLITIFFLLYACDVKYLTLELRKWVQRAQWDAEYYYPNQILLLEGSITYKREDCPDRRRRPPKHSELSFSHTTPSDSDS